MKTICVFCGSSPGALPAYREAAETLGKLLASRGIGLVYGGGSVGLMGIIADAVLHSGGSVTGVIPRDMAEKGVAHNALTELQYVADMHERKTRMFSLSDAFITLPGGLGTLEEIFEVVTWAQLGYHTRPCGFLNITGYYDHLVAFLDHAAGQGFIGRAHREMILVDTAPQTLLERIGSYVPPADDKLAKALESTARARGQAN